MDDVSLFLRLFWLVAVVSITGCVGGPVSDLPHSGDNGGPGRGPDQNDDEGSSGGLDAGTGFPQLDAGVPMGTMPDAHVGIPCDDAGAPSDGG